MEERKGSGLLGRLGSRRARFPRRGGAEGADGAGATPAEDHDAPPADPEASTGSATALGDPATGRPEAESSSATHPTVSEPEPHAGDGGGEPRAGTAEPPAGVDHDAPTSAETASAPRPKTARPRGLRASSTRADPAPLGLAALALTVLVLSLFTSGLLPESGEPVVFGLAFAYGGLVQLLAGMWAFRTASTFAATAFASYGAFFLSYALLEAFFAEEVPAADLSVYLGWTLLAWALFTTGLYAVSFRANGRVNVVFLLLGATFYLVGVGEAAGVELVTRVGGYVGIVTALAAGFAAFATMADEAVGQRILPAPEPEPGNRRIGGADRNGH